MLFVFSAPSGSGKSTLINHLMSQVEGLTFSVSATSRAPRGEEKDGVEYHFLSEEEFRRKIAEDAFVEYEEVYAGTFYGTLKSEIDGRLAKGENVVLDVDVKGGLSVKRIYGDKALLIFIQPPSIEELRRRLEKRGTDSPEKIQQRIDKAAYELTFAPQFDIVITNDDLETAKKEVVDTVKKETHPLTPPMKGGEHKPSPFRGTMEGISIAIFGGSFNPVHYGHVAIAKSVVESGLVDEVWLMVSPRNPLKKDSDLMPNRQRLQLARQAVKGIKGVKVSDFEMHLPKPSYTYLTLRRLRKAYPDVEFSLLIGGDNWLIFDKWKNAEEILRSTPIIIYPRKGSEIDVATLPPNVTFLDMPLYNISSTEIRAKKKTKKNSHASM